MVGATGHTGGEMCRLLLGHPSVAEILPVSRSETAFERVHPNLLGCGLEFASPDALEQAAAGLDVVFLCTPAGEAMRLAPRLLAAGARVVDLSPDFRFADAALYSRTYGIEHTAPALLAEAAYGATELNRKRIAEARLVANPGCYVLTALLGLAPLLRSGLADVTRPLHLSAVNGTTGAGSSPRTEVMHAEVFASMLSYSLQGHRHVPEMEEQLTALAGHPVQVDLTTAHGNFARGIHLQAGVPLRPEHADRVGRSELLRIYRDHYGPGASGEFFVRLNEQPAEGGPTAKDYRRYPGPADVAGSNFCHLGLDCDTRRGVAKVVAVTDNLVKGAAGSAIQNMNVMCGLDETAGLRGYGL